MNEFIDIYLQHYIILTLFPLNFLLGAWSFLDYNLFMYYHDKDSKHWENSLYKPSIFSPLLLIGFIFCAIFGIISFLSNNDKINKDNYDLNKGFETFWKKDKQLVINTLYFLPILALLLLWVMN